VAQCSQPGLSHLPGIRPYQAVVSHRQHRTALSDQWAYVKERRDHRCPVPFIVEAMFDHSLTLIEAELAWVEGFINQMEEDHVES
jgi:hypothetical protein